MMRRSCMRSWLVVAALYALVSPSGSGTVEGMPTASSRRADKSMKLDTVRHSPSSISVDFNSGDDTSYSVGGSTFSVRRVEKEKDRSTSRKISAESPPRQDVSHVEWISVFNDDIHNSGKIAFFLWHKFKRVYKEGTSLVVVTKGGKRYHEVFKDFEITEMEVEKLNKMQRLLRVTLSFPSTEQ